HPAAERVGAVICSELAIRPVGHGRPGFSREEPVAHAARVQPRHVGVRRGRGLEERADSDPTRVLAELLLQHVAGSPTLQRLESRGVVAWMPARRTVPDLPTRDGRGRTGDTKDEPVVVRDGDRALQVELYPPLRARFDVVAFEKDRP